MLTFFAISPFASFADQVSIPIAPRQADGGLVPDAATIDAATIGGVDVTQPVRDGSPLVVDFSMPIAQPAPEDPVTLTLRDGLDGYAGTRDTYLHHAHTGIAYGDSDTIEARYDWRLALVYFAVWQRDGGPVPDNADIQSATLRIYKRSGYPERYRLLPMLTAWHESATYDAPMAGGAWHAAGLAQGYDYTLASHGELIATSAVGWVSVDVTAGMQSVARGATWHGWHLQPITSGYNRKQYHSSEYVGDPSLRPTLEITYIIREPSDADADGVDDTTDNCQAVANPEQTDSDRDGVGNACDADNDADLTDDFVDNCPATWNPWQEDADADGQGDACDFDADNDTAPDSEDNCPTIANAGQADLDADGLGDDCDVDIDGDNVQNAGDNCPRVANVGQEDIDRDTLGDACDPDTDGDGVPNGTDNCPTHYNAQQHMICGDNISYADRLVVLPDSVMTGWRSVGSGAALDQSTGLVWMTDGECLPLMDWQSALDVSATYPTAECPAGDGSAAGDWRLPNIAELETLSDYRYYGPAVAADNPMTLHRSPAYWSSTTRAETTAQAWTWEAIDGHARPPSKAESYAVLLVRDARPEELPVVELGEPVPDDLTVAKGRLATPLIQTGQIACYAATGEVVDCAGTGQDGELQRGYPVPPVRFVDSGDGTVTDSVTERVWLQDVTCYDRVHYPDAVAAVAATAIGQCGLVDDSVAGDWMMPTIQDIGHILDWSQFDSAMQAGHPFVGVPTYRIWSSTTGALRFGLGWVRNLGNGVPTTDEMLDGQDIHWTMPMRVMPAGPMLLPCTVTDAVATCARYGRTVRFRVFAGVDFEPSPEPEPNPEDPPPQRPNPEPIASLGCPADISGTFMRGRADRHYWDESVQGYSVGGATWTSWNRNEAGSFLWSQPGGDWLDADGVLHGPKAWASIDRSVANQVGQWHEWDVTALVNDWLAGREAQGFNLRHDGAAKFRYSSREGEDAPELLIDGVRVLASKDTTLTSSTTKPMGHLDNLESSNSYLRFQVGDLSGPVTSAVLRMRVVGTSGYGVSALRVFEATTVPHMALHDPGGIAKAYPNDAGLESHPSVYVSDNMDSGQYSDAWSLVDMAGQPAQSVDMTTGGTMQACHGLSGVCSITGDRINGGECRIEYVFRKAGKPEPSRVFTRAMVALPPEMILYGEGGKMLTGTISNYLGTPYQGGNSGVPSNGRNGWSTRGAYALPYQAPNNVLFGHVPLGTYVYHIDQTGLYGDVAAYEDPRLSAPPPMQWYCVEMEAQINSVGLHGEARQDGVIRAWINDYLVYQRTNYRFTALPIVEDSRGIERVYNRAFSGGLKIVPVDSRFMVDNLVVADERIGCPVFEVAE